MNKKTSDNLATYLISIIAGFIASMLFLTVLEPILKNTSSGLTLTVLIVLTAGFTLAANYILKDIK